MTLEERLLLKFRIMVKEVEKRISYKLDSSLNKATSDNVDYSDISPLRLIFPEYVDNQYIKIMISKISSIFPNNNIDKWATSCTNSSMFLSNQKRTELADIYIQLHSFKRGNFKAFIFWSMIGVIVDNNQKDEKLSLVIDFARIFGMSEGEILDLSQVARAFFGEQDNSFKFVSNDVESIFSGVYAYLLN